MQLFVVVVVPVVASLWALLRVASCPQSNRALAIVVPACVFLILLWVYASAMVLKVSNLAAERPPRED